MQYIKFETATQGMSARRLLAANGIHSMLKRNPHPNHKEGCTFALFVEADLPRAVELLRRAGIPHRGVAGGDGV